MRGRRNGGMTGGTRGRWRAVAVIAGLLGLVGLMVLLGLVLQAEGLQTAANVAQLVAVVLAVAPLVTGLLAWCSSGSSTEVVSTMARIADATDVLAWLVRQQWEDEATKRLLDDPHPMPVQWRFSQRQELMEHPGEVGTFAGASDQITSLTEQYRNLNRRRLVILGGPGTGKTTLAVQLVRGLLETRQEHEPVPVMLSVADWNTETFPHMRDWLAARLGQDYPGLRGTLLGAEAPTTLATRRHILPVLDGLDELPAPARAGVIAALNRSLRENDQLILTSRTNEFAAAVNEAGNKLISAAVIVPRLLAPATAADYLQACLQPGSRPIWQKTLGGLRTAPSSRPMATLAELASTPLGLWLLRTVYIRPGADPISLIDPGRFPNAAALRAHLLDGVIPALVTTQAPRTDSAEPFQPRWSHDPDRVSRWLGYLADHLSQIPINQGQTGTRDLAWWHLARHTLHPRTLPLTVGIGAGIVCGFVFGLVAGIVAGVWVGVMGGLTAGLLSGIMAGSDASWWSRESPGFADFQGTGRKHLLLRFIMQEMLGFGLIAGFGSGLAGGLASGLLAGFLAIPDFGIGLGLVSVLAFGLIGGLAFGTVGALVFGIVFGGGSAIIGWVETPTPAGQANTPMANWRADRRLNLTRSIVSGLGVGLVASPLAGLGVGMPTGLVVGFGSGLVFGLVLGVNGGKHHAWLAYLVTTCYLAWQGRLPRRLMLFLEYAHRLGLLRAVGPIYQFRHAELQDHLAQAYRIRKRIKPGRGPAPQFESTALFLE